MGLRMYGGNGVRHTSDSDEKSENENLTSISQKNISTKS